jgi:hypothetical protein
VIGVGVCFFVRVWNVSFAWRLDGRMPLVR